MIRNALQLVPTAKLFADVRGNPVAANVEAGLKAYTQGAHDGVVAFGGGSGVGLAAAKLLASKGAQVVIASRTVGDLEETLAAYEGRVTAHAVDGKVDRSRPLCPHPQVARYTGSGDVNDATNFRCDAP